MKRSLRTLQHRGSHRLSGNPALGSISAFLNVVFFIRMAANTILVIDLANRGARLDIPQIAGTYAIVFFAYLVWIGSLSTHRAGLALPERSFVALASKGREFKVRFILRTALRRPLHIAAVAFILISAVAFALIQGSWKQITFECGTVFLIAPLAAAGIVALAGKTLKNSSEIQVLEFLAIVFMVTRNPDIGSHNEMVSLSIGGTFYPFSLPAAFFIAIGIVVAAMLLLPILEGALSSLKGYLGRAAFMSPIVHWYWRSVKIRSWLILYLLTAPAFLSSLATGESKRWALALSLLFGAGSYFYFVVACENTLRNVWRCSLFDTGNKMHLVRTAALHGTLLCVPIAGFILGRFL